MSNRHVMHDLIVVLPGIMGSVLRHKDNTIWSMPRLIGPALTGKTAQFEPLYLAGDDDPEREHLPDGIHATELVTGIHGIHGLALGEGYKKLIDTITARFQVIPGGDDPEAPANFFPFPYDWRRDNRAAAHRLKALIDARLPLWRKRHAKARVILIAHSMGGLVARYYLERLGGWQDCRALFTFGTPHRGSLNALDSLCNQHRLGRADLTALVRSFTAPYQLLPIYPVVRGAGADDRPLRVAEIAELPGLSQDRAAAGLAFHHEIKAGVQQRDPRHSQCIYPIAGTRKKTHQSALLSNDRVVMSEDLPEKDSIPPGHDTEWLRSGDGTVPYISAIPVELSLDYRETFYSEDHSWLTSNKAALQHLCRLIARMQLDDRLAAFEGELAAPEAALRPALSLELDTVYRRDEIIRPRAQIVNQAEDPVQVWLRLSPEDGGAEQEQALEPDGAAWSAELRDVPPGVYRVEVRTYREPPLSPPPAHSILEVVEPSP